MIEGLPADPIRWYEGMRLRVLVDAPTAGGQFALCEVHAPAGAATSVHRHEHEDEVVHVRAGRVDLWTRDEHRILGAGESGHLPRGVPHRLRALGDGPADLLIAFMPGGVEASLLAASTTDADGPLDPDDLAALLSAAGIRTLPWEQPPALEA
ncbi:MAG: cupin domain-containing protein [Patulibacter minatonensis]